MGIFDDVFSDNDDLAETEQEQKPATVTVADTEKPKPKPAKPKRNLAGAASPKPASVNGPRSKHAYLFFDLETVPDYSRIEQFDLPKLPPRKDTDLLSAKEFCSMTLADVKKFLDENLPPDSWLDSVEAEENASKKPRAGLFEAIAKSRGMVDSQRKTLSVTPEFCRIAAACWQFGNSNSGRTVVLSPVNGEYPSLAEAGLLEEFWKAIADVRTIVGFNVLHFDLPVIMVRSALLGVTPSRRINLSPYRNTEVCDLMTMRWPKGGQMKLKAMANALGIEVPADDCDGSQVETLYNSDPEMLKKYVASDVQITREIHQTLSGYFWE